MMQAPGSPPPTHLQAPQHSRPRRRRRPRARRHDGQALQYAVVAAAAATSSQRGFVDLWSAKTCKRAPKCQVSWHHSHTWVEVAERGMPARRTRSGRRRGGRWWNIVIAQDMDKGGGGGSGEGK
eukprot:364011-Chlamydomonas_euryale.AAC.6